MTVPSRSPDDDQARSSDRMTRTTGPHPGRSTKVAPATAGVQAEGLAMRRSAATRPATMKVALVGTRGVPARYGGFETALEEGGRPPAERGHEGVVYCRTAPRGTEPPAARHPRGRPGPRPLRRVRDRRRGGRPPPGRAGPRGRRLLPDRARGHRAAGGRAPRDAAGPPAGRPQAVAGDPEPHGAVGRPPAGAPGRRRDRL